MADGSRVNSQAAQDRIATLALSLFALHGYPAPGGDRLGSIVHQALAAVGPDELRRPESISAAALGRIDELVKGSVEAGRPRNVFGAEAARAAQATTGASGRAGMSLGQLDALRAGSSARFRELAAEGGSRSGSQSAAGSLVIPEFARSFAGTGMSSGTLRTFSEVGLDRGTFNQFRKEGFSNAQIVDSAKDSQVLHFKGKDDLSAAQHAPVDLRKAAVKVEQATSPEQKTQAQDHKAGVARKYEALPDGDPRKQRARDLIRALDRHGHHVDLNAGKVGARATQDDASMAEDHAGGAQAANQATQDGLAAKGAKQKTAALTTSADDAFGASTPSAGPKKPEPVRTAGAKPANPAPSV